MPMAWERINLVDDLSYLYEKIHRRLMDEISSGARKPGDKLPTELELANDYGVSRITSKKALNMLAQQGLVVRKRGLGTFVTLPGEKEKKPRAGHSSFSLRDPGNKRLGLIMEDLGESYALGLFYEIDNQATQQGYQVCLGMSYGNQGMEREALHKLLALDISGLIVMPAHGSYYDTDLLRLVLDHFPLVIIDRPLHGIPAPSIYSDNEESARTLAQLLIRKGHRNIVYISTDINEAISLEDRYRGYEKAMTQHGLKAQPPVVVPRLARFGLSAGKLITEHMEKEDYLCKWLMANPDVTAVIGSEYGIAHMTRQAAAKLERRVPEDLAICCFDAKYGYLGEYDLTHIRQDEAAIARTALEVISAMLEGKNMRRQTWLIPTRLMEGTST
jgi:DNA-binding LacI/PurR family transcriptional regulator